MDMDSGRNSGSAPQPTHGPHRAEGESMKYIESYRKNNKAWWGIDLPRAVWIVLAGVSVISIVVHFVR